MYKSNFDKFFKIGFTSLMSSLFTQYEKEKSIKLGKFYQNQRLSLNIESAKAGFRRYLFGEKSGDSAVNTEIPLFPYENDLTEIFIDPNTTEEKEIAIKYFEKWKPDEKSSHYYCLLYLLSSLSFLLTIEEDFGKLREDKLYPFIYNDSQKRFFGSVVYSYRDVCSGEDISEGLREARRDNCKELVKTFCYECLSEDKEEPEAYRSVYLLSYLYAFGISLTNPRMTRNELYMEAQAKIALECLTFAQSNSNYENYISLAKKSIFTLDCRDRLNAFNLLGLCSINTGRNQLAYDTYYSWINANVSDDLANEMKLKKSERIRLQMIIQSEETAKWLADEDHINLISMIYANMSYVCKLLKNPDSLKYIRKAIDMNPTYFNYHVQKGDILSATGKVNSTLNEYRLAYELAYTNAYKLVALSYYLNYSILHYKSMSSDLFERYSNVYVKLYQNLRDADHAARNEDRILSQALAQGSDLFYTLKSCKELSRKNRSCQDLIFKIYEIASQILLKLKTNGRGDIAYYASLNNMKHLFEEVDLNEGKIHANCITMMHARYMNDPEEGLILLKQLNTFIKDDPEKLRDDLYSQKHVFLKSFTSLIDQLNMWSMYGRDLSEEKDCNGCCICFDSETLYNSARLALVNVLVSPEYIRDDYNLYNVAYYKDGQYFIGNADNHSSEFGNLIQRLKTNVKSVFKLLDLSPNEKDQMIVRECVIRLLEKPMFLIKDYSYHLENECRLIVSRDILDSFDIQKTDGNPPKLFVNPPFQVFPKRVIIGPKVDDPDYWKPYIQFELSKIKKKWTFSDQDNYNPEIVVSEISIR